MKKVKLGHKILVTFLALLMVFTSFPIVNTFAADENLGQISAITDANAKIDTQESAGISTTTVTFNNCITLEWSAKNEQRSKDGWWVGIKMTAPDFETEVLEAATYESLSYGADEWVLGKSFWDNKDSKDSDEEHYITLWAFVDLDNIKLAKSKEEAISVSWSFDWDNNGQNDQIVTTNIDPEAVVLKKDNKQVYPALPGTVEAITAKDNAVVDAEDSANITVNYSGEFELNWSAKNEQRSKDGWWVGIKMTAPDLNVSALKEATYESLAYGTTEPITGKKFWTNKDSKDSDEEHYITLWAFVNEESLNNALASGTIETSWSFDWDNDGENDQAVTIKINPSEVILIKDEKKVYRTTGLGSVEGITGGPTVTNNKTNAVTVTYDEKVTLQWSQADSKIGRNADGWWAGIKMTAPEDADLANAKYASMAYGASDWVLKKSFDSAKDGSDYITLWAYVANQDMLDSADGSLVTKWKFDWNNDGVYEQLVCFELDPSNIELDYTNLFAMDKDAPVFGDDITNIEKDAVDWVKGTATISGTVTDEGDYASDIADLYYVEGEYSTKEGIPEDATPNAITLEDDGKSFKFVIETEDENVYTIVAVDNNGNSATTVVYTKIDNTAPVVNEILVGDKVYGTNELEAINESQTVTIDVIDELSGIATVTVNGEAITDEDGKYSFVAEANGEYEIVVTDKVGLESKTSVTIDNFDDQGPSASLKILEDESLLDKIITAIKKLLRIKDDKKVTLTVHDVETDGENEKYLGISEAYYYFYNKEDGSVESAETINEAFVKENGTKIETSADGIYSAETEFSVGANIVFVLAYDIAGNPLFASSDGYAFEETGPTITVSNGETSVNINNELKLKDAPDFTITVEDKAESGEFISGIQRVTMSVNGGEPITLEEVEDSSNVLLGKTGTLTFAKKDFKSILDVKAPGEYEITVTAIDMCGNESTFTFGYKYDNIAPKFSDLTYNKLEGETEWSHSASVTFKVTDQYTENGDLVPTEVKTVKYAVFYTNEIDLNNDSIVWETATGDNGVFTVDEKYVVDGAYTMYVAVQYGDDCSNATTPAIQSVEIKKDTVAPEIDHFELSVEKNNGIQKLINWLSFGLFFNEDVTLKVYTKDATSGLYDNALLIYNREVAEKDQTITTASAADSDKNIIKMELSKDGDYYECTLPLDNDIIYESLSVVVADNYCISDSEYPQTSTATLTSKNLVVDGYDEEVSENIHIQLENVAPVIADVTVKSNKSSSAADKTVYSKDFTSAITVQDEQSGLNNVNVSVDVHGSVTECEFDIYGTVSSQQIREATFTYDAEKNTVTGAFGDEKIVKTVGKLAVSDENKVTLTVKATDNAGNPADEKIYDYTIDNKAPEIKAYCSIDDYYTKADEDEDEVVYTFTTDEQAEAGVVTYTYNGNERTSPTDENLCATFRDEGKYVIKKIVVTDLLGNSTTIEAKDFDCITEFVIDRTVPTITSIEFTGESSLANYFRLLSFGVFTKDAVVVTVNIDNTTGTDKLYTSPLDEAASVLRLTPVDGSNSEYIKPTVTEKRNEETTAIESWTLTYRLSLSKIGTLTIEAIDKATNTTGDINSKDAVEVKNCDGMTVTFDDEKIESNFFLSENTAPEITITEEAADIANETNNERLTHYIDSNGKLWFNDDIIIPVKVVDGGDDLISGLYDVTITVNNVEYKTKTHYDGDYYNKSTTVYLNRKVVSTPSELVVDTSKCTIGKNGEYHIVVEAVDYARNVATAEFTVYKDTEAPYVEFAFNNVGNQDSLKDGKVELVEFEDAVYGYYFVKDTQVTITATDRNNSSSAVGVKSITYYAIDRDTNEVISDTVDVDKYNRITFTVPANFKGQIYAYATDSLGNNYSTAGYCNDEDKLVDNPLENDGVKCAIPDKTIVETDAKHSEETHISYEVITKTSTKDASGYDIYNKSVDVKVTITDTYSGIRSGNIVVTSDENSTDVNDSNFTIENLDNYIGKQINGWTIDEMDENLVTKISKTIRITRNSNNIFVSASMEDRAGNETENVSLEKFSIDTVAPEITVRYSNNSASDSKYFKANRTATITVTERNFDPALVTAKVNGKEVSLKWSESNYNNNSNKEGTTYTATITYNSDGDYTFGIACKDRAENADNSPSKYTGQTAPTDFVIDKTAPVVTVSTTSAARPQNTNYFSKPVQVTVTVVEHNWDASKFNVIYAENDANVGKTLSWTNNGDTHTATFICDSVTGLKYTIDYTLADKAANNAVFVQNGSRVNDYRPDEFYVDQTIPTITFTGAIEGSHNNDSIESGIVLADTYYDRVEVTLSGKRRGIVLQETYTNTEINITEFVETTRDKDDYYTISVTAYDKAGNNNATPATRSYSVNRRGSMFVVSDDAKKFNEGTNSQNVVNGNIVIYEYNVDRTVSELVELWKNGNVIKLSRGNGGYTVSTVENQNGYICNTYSISSSLFEDDAAYRIYITTEDEAGNVSTNTSKASAAVSSLDKNDGSAPILSFIKDTTPPVIDINLDITKTTYYPISQDKYMVTFTITDAGSGVNLDSVLVTYGNGEKTEVIDLIKNEDGSYSIELSGTYRNLSFTFTDNAGNEFNSLVFNRLTVSANPLVRLINNTPLLIGIIAAFVVIAIIIILIAKKKKKNDEEKN